MKTYDVYKAIEEQGKRKFRRKLDNKIYEWDPHFHRFNLANNPIEWIIPGLGDEWEEVKEPVDFIEAVKSGKKIRSVTWMQNTELDLPNLLYDMSDFDEKEIRQLLLGKWYIED